VNNTIMGKDGREGRKLSALTTCFLHQTSDERGFKDIEVVELVPFCDQLWSEPP
jgi:hypothetical protein